MLNSSEPIKVAQLQKLDNQSVLNSARVIEMVNNSFREIKKNFCRLMKWGTSKLLDFAKYLSCLEVQKNSKITNAYIWF